MDHQVTQPELSNSRLKWIYRISGAAALIVGILLLIAMMGLTITAFLPQTTNSWLSSLEDNWLVVIFKLHAGFSGVQTDQLQVLNLLDIAILVLVGLVHVGLFVDLRKTSKIWSTIALVQPILGIVIFIVTKTAGRSTVMGAGLVASIVMLRSIHFNKGTAYIGILASLLLLVGDFSAGMPPNAMIAFLFGIGYMLLILWFFLIARRLFQS